MVIIITGAIGIGKTTVCRKLVEKVREQGFTCGGILTCKAADGSITIEDIQTGEKQTLAGIDKAYHGPSTAKYYFNPDGIDFGIRAIESGTSAAILVVDEIGHLELRGEGFTGVLELLEADKVKSCVLVIREELLPAFLSQLPAAPLIFETTIHSRSHLPHEISSVLFEKLAAEDATAF